MSKQQYLYISGASGIFQDPADTINKWFGASATVDAYSQNVNRYLVNGVEGQSLTLLMITHIDLIPQMLVTQDIHLALGQPVTGLQQELMERRELQEHTLK